MSGSSSGYDLSVATFSPEGRIFQIEYASKCVDNCNNVIGVILNDGIILAVERLLSSKLEREGDNSHIFCIDKHISIAVGGSIPDGRALVHRARSEAADYRKVFQEPIPGKILADRIGLYMHAYTLMWSERPFGAGLIIGVSEIDKNGDEENPVLSLYTLDPSGVSYKCFGCAIGKGQRNAKTEIERLHKDDLMCSDALVDIVKLFRRSQDTVKHQEIEIDMVWICKDSNWEHAVIPRLMIQEAVDDAIKIIDEEDL